MNDKLENGGQDYLLISESGLRQLKAVARWGKIVSITGIAWAIFVTASNLFRSLARTGSSSSMFLAAFPVILMIFYAVFLFNFFRFANNLKKATDYGDSTGVEIAFIYLKRAMVWLLIHIGVQVVFNFWMQYRYL